MKAEVDPNLAEWLKRHVHTSPEIQNEVMKVIDLRILREIAAEFQNSPFIAIMADETTDAANNE